MVNRTFPEQIYRNCPSNRPEDNAQDVYCNAKSSVGWLIDCWCSGVEGVRFQPARNGTTGGAVKWMSSQRAATHTYVTQQRSPSPSPSTKLGAVALLDCLLSTGSDKSVLALLCIIYFWPRSYLLLLLSFVAIARITELVNTKWTCIN